MIKAIGTLLYTSFYAVFLQNLVLCGGFGLSPLLRSAANPKQGFRYCGAVMWFSTLISVLCGYLFQLPALTGGSTGIHIAVTGGVLLLCYLITLGAVKLFFHASSKSLLRLGACAFNSLVMAVPLVNLRMANPLLEGAGLGIGAGLSFALSVWLLTFGIRKLEQNDHIPPWFQGLPGLFVYVGILSMAFMAVLGRVFMV